MSETNSREQRRARWAERIEAWQASGESGAAFCREHELVYSQFICKRQKWPMSILWVSGSILFA